MVAGSKIEGGTAQTNIPPRVRITIQSIKEIVKGHSDADIYAALKESNMDPNETAQKLLNQDPFHEVKRRRDKRKEVKENVVHKVPLGSRKNSENMDRGTTSLAHPDHNFRTGSYMRNVLSANGGYPRRTFSANGRIGREFRVVKNSRDFGTGKEFRVVRDNRVSQSISGEESAPQPYSVLPIEQAPTTVSGKGSSTDTVDSQRLSWGQGLSTTSNGQLHHKPDLKSRLDGQEKETVKDKGALLSNSKTTLHVKVVKPETAQPRTPKAASSNSAPGLYSSDPIHVPTPESRSNSTVGAIKREVGVVGGRKKPGENPGRHASSPEVTSSNLISGRDGSPQEELNQFHARFSETSQPESSVLSVSTSKSSFSQHGGKLNQQVGHQKAPQPVKEWKPKSSQKPVAKSPGVIGSPSPAKSPANDPKGLDLEAVRLQDRLSQVNIRQAQNVIIPQHIRVPEADRCHWTFGSFGAEFGSTRDSVSVESEEPKMESATGSAVSVNATSLSEETSVNKQVDLHDEQVRDSKLDSPSSSETVELQLHEKKEADPENFENYANIDVARVNTPSYTPPEPQQHSEFPSFSAYDPQTGYDIPYFRSAVDESGRPQVIQSPQEASNLHVPSSTLASTVAMMQQQQQHQQQQHQQPLAQMYQQVHVSHFANLMPYRQLLSPVYVPPVAMPGYSSNPGFPHPSNGNGYVLMPGASSHLNSNSLKYGIQQFKPVPAGSPAGFGNFASPTGFAVNAPGVVGSATLEDSSRIKYKDGNPYIPNPPAETSEMWIQNPREHSGLQSAPFYNMPGQSPHPAYLPSHTGHASFNAAVSQSSHMQFPGMYHHPPQATAIANPHHISPAMGGNVGVGMAAAAPGTQVGAYQQPQLGHINWTGNF